MTRRLEHWRCDVCRERGRVPSTRSAGALLQRVLAQHFERSSDCPLAARQPLVDIGHDGAGWVLGRPQSTGPPADNPA